MARKGFEVWTKKFIWNSYNRTHTTQLVTSRQGVSFISFIAVPCLSYTFNTHVKSEIKALWFFNSKITISTMKSINAAHAMKQKENPVIVRFICHGWQTYILINMFILLKMQFPRACVLYLYACICKLDRKRERERERDSERSKREIQLERERERKR